MDPSLGTARFLPRRPPPCRPSAQLRRLPGAAAAASGDPAEASLVVAQVSKGLAEGGRSKQVIIIGRCMGHSFFQVFFGFTCLDAATMTTTMLGCWLSATSLIANVAKYPMNQRSLLKVFIITQSGHQTFSAMAYTLLGQGWHNPSNSRGPTGSSTQPVFYTHVSVCVAQRTQKALFLCGKAVTTQPVPHIVN